MLGRKFMLITWRDFFCYYINMLKDARLWIAVSVSARARKRHPIPVSVPLHILWKLVVIKPICMFCYVLYITRNGVLDDSFGYPKLLDNYCIYTTQILTQGQANSVCSLYLIILLVNISQGISNFLSIIIFEVC